MIFINPIEIKKGLCLLTTSILLDLHCIWHHICHPPQKSTPTNCIRINENVIRNVRSNQTVNCGRALQSQEIGMCVLALPEQMMFAGIAAAHPQKVWRLQSSGLLRESRHVPSLTFVRHLPQFSEPNRRRPVSAY